jgi:hypothetical protein
MRSQLTSGSRNCLLEDGSYKQVFEGPITPSTPWLRYVYSKFGKKRLHAHVCHA